MSLIISPKQYEALAALEDNTHKEIFYGGAAGGGKSYIGCLWQIRRRLMHPKTRGLIGRSTLLNLHLTTLKTFFELWEDYFQYNDAGITLKPNYQKNVISFSNGSEIIIKDLSYKPRFPNYEYLGSLNLADAFIDEVTEIDEKAYNILFTRIRENTINGVPKLLSASNPAHNWTKFRFIRDKKTGQAAKLLPTQKVIRALVDDNIDKEFVRIYKESLQQLPRAERNRLLYGDWDYIPEGDFFAYEFDTEENVSQYLELDENERIILGFDFNYNPTTCVMAQQTNEGLIFIKEWAVKGGTAKLCQRIKQDLPFDEIRHKIFITGDHSGNSRSSTAGSVTDYHIISHELNISPQRFINVNSANLMHQESQDLCNFAFCHIPIKISATGCPALIQDLGNAQMKDGKLLKNDAVGLHLLDCYRYIINAFFLNRSKDVLKLANKISPNYYKRKLQQ